MAENQGIQADPMTPVCYDLVRKLRYLARDAEAYEAGALAEAATVIVQLCAALGYPIPADEEHHIIPRNPYQCGVCDARARTPTQEPVNE